MGRGIVKNSDTHGRLAWGADTSRPKAQWKVGYRPVGALGRTFSELGKLFPHLWKSFWEVWKSFPPIVKAGDWLILQYKNGPDAKAVTARLEYNTEICEGCKKAEWVCECKKEDEKK